MQNFPAEEKTTSGGVEIDDKCLRDLEIVKVAHLLKACQADLRLLEARERMLCRQLNDNYNEYKAISASPMGRIVPKTPEDVAAKCNNTETFNQLVDDLQSCRAKISQHKSQLNVLRDRFETI